MLNTSQVRNHAIKRETLTAGHDRWCMKSGGGAHVRMSKLVHTYVKALTKRSDRPPHTPDHAFQLRSTGCIVRMRWYKRQGRKVVLLYPRASSSVPGTSEACGYNDVSKYIKTRRYSLSTAGNTDAMRSYQNTRSKISEYMYRKVNIIMITYRW